MSKRIKGLTVTIGADTTGLDKALSGIEKQSRETATELRDINKLLKFNPENVDMLAQQQKVLGDQVENAREKLDKLKDAEKEVQDQFKKGEIKEEQYRNFQREVVEAESKLKHFEDQLESTQKKETTFGDKMDKLAGKFNSAGDSMKQMGGTLTTSVTAPIVGLSALAVEGTRDLRETLGKLETNAELAGQSIEGVQDNLRDLNAVTGETDSNVEALSNLMEAGFTNESLTSAVDALSGAVIKFPDTLKIEGLADGLQETLATGAATGSFGEMLERLGYNLDDFNEGLAAATEAGEEQQYIMDVLASTGLADVNEAYRENNASMIEAKESQHDLQMATAELGELLEPIFTKITQGAVGILNAFNNLSPGGKKIALILGGIAAAAGPVLVGLGTLTTSVSALAPLATGLAGAVGAITAPMVGVGLAVAGVIAAGVLLYQNWDLVKEKAAQFSAYMGEKFENIKNSITEKINYAKDGVKDAIDKIKGFFKFQWSLPKLKLPHISITGGFSISPPRVPKFGIKWYEKGGIFNAPSIIGVGEGRGPEAVLPIEKLSGILAETLSRMGSVGSGSSSNMKIDHSGVIRVEGYSSNGEFDQVVEIIKDQLRRDGRG